MGVDVFARKWILLLCVQARWLQDLSLLLSVFHSSKDLSIFRV